MVVFPVVSVLLPIYKEPLLWIAQSIESILQQSFSDFELLLLVDNPDDKKLVKFLQKYKQDKRVQLVINAANLGLPFTLNKGIELAKGKYIARMDADDIALPLRLEKQYYFMEQHPEIDLCGSQVMKINEEGSLLRPSNNFSNPELLSQLIPYCNVITHPTWFIKKSIYLEIGNYRNFPNSEDYDLAYRLIDAGKKITNLAEVLLYLRVHLHGQTGKKSLVQKTCFTYLKILHQERIKNGIDHFKEEALRKKIEENEKHYGKQQQRAQQYLYKAFQHLAKKEYLRVGFYLSCSFLISPIQRGYYLDLLRAKWVILKYKTSHWFNHLF